MSNELLELWKKRGMASQTGARSKVEQKAPQPTFVPMVPKTESTNSVPKAPTKYKTANDEMHEIMRKKEEMQANVGPQKTAPKKTYLNEIQDTMKVKQEVGFKPKEFSKVTAVAEEMQKTMQKKQMQSKETIEERPEPNKEPPAQPKVIEKPIEPKVEPKIEPKVLKEQKKEEKRKTANEEMMEIMKNRQNLIKSKDEPKRKTANEEMQEIMRSKGEKKPGPKPTKEKKPIYLEPSHFEETKQIIPNPAPVQVKAKSSTNQTGEAKTIEQDEEMRKIKELLESQIKFTAGDNLELKPKPKEEPIEQGNIEVEEPSQENEDKEVEDSDSPKDNPNATHKPEGLFADD